MHTRQAIAAILGLMLMTSACSSELEEAQPLAIGTTGSDAAFSYYDQGESQDRVVTAQEILEGEKRFGATAVTSLGVARQLVSDYDFDGDGALDNLEFTGLVHARVLSGVLYNPHWTNPGQSQ
ncbi:hypothetical protein [Oligoflexus tunisiensis]|uniref:hypothetical protein n=1 Tax=Oligoflexus tunisiensis TaxID=708132 RepID=UPI00114CF04A|nr:hypothetical protein [Oligoflexus tunisiensis]